MTNPAGRKNNRYAVEVHGRHGFPSVTTVIGVLDKPALSFAAAKETALFAVHQQRQWRHLAPAHAVDKLKRQHRVLWDEKASRGTTVHDLANSWSQGVEVEVPADCLPYMDALEQFYRDWEPRWVEVERTVIYRGERPYGGSFDAIADLVDGRRWILDLKTGSSVWETVALQLAAYRYAEHIGLYDETGDLIGTEPMIPVDACGVIHLRSDGTYGLVPVQAGREEWDYFMACRQLWEFVNTKTKTKRIGEPLPAPKEERV